MAATTQTNQTHQTTDNRNKTRKNDMFEQMTDTIKSTMDTGMRMQQDAVRSMFGCTTGAETFEDVRGRMERMTNDSIEMMRKNAEQGEKLFDATCRSGMDMVRKTFDTVREQNGERMDVVDQCRSAWKNGFEAMRTGMDHFAKGQMTMIENWASFLDKTLATVDRPAAK